MRLRLADLFPLAALVIGALWLVGAGAVNAQVRIKDITSFEGVRENMLVG